MKAAVVGSLVDEYNEIRLLPYYSASVVLSSGNYPQDGNYGKVIEGLETASEYGEISHFNTILNSEGKYVTAGGRTLVATATASTLEKAAKAVYDSVEEISFEGMRYRKDIGKTMFVGC